MEISPHSLIPLHGARNAQQLKRLVSDMLERGWAGRPLLVVESERGYFAWTGSHRIAAAREVGLTSIPCHVIAERLIMPFNVTADWGHVDDSERLAIARKTGDPGAIELMWLEGRDN